MIDSIRDNPHLDIDYSGLVHDANGCGQTLHEVPTSLVGTPAMGFLGRQWREVDAVSSSLRQYDVKTVGYICSRSHALPLICLSVGLILFH